MLVFPAEWYEGFPLTIAEAFATGLPVLASRIGAMVELVDDRRTGLLFTPGDPAALAEAVLWAQERPEHMAVMGRLAREEYLPNTPRNGTIDCCTRYTPTRSQGSGAERSNATKGTSRQGDKLVKVLAPTVDAFWRPPGAHEAFHRATTGALRGRSQMAWDDPEPVESWHSASLDPRRRRPERAGWVRQAFDQMPWVTTRSWTSLPGRSFCSAEAGRPLEGR